MQQVRNADGSLGRFPDTAGVYGIFDGRGELQYIGLSRKVSATITTYAKDLPELTQAVKIATPAGASREELVNVWKQWMQQAVEETGKVPPGNNRDNDTWTPKRPLKGEIKLTPGKGIQDLNCSIETLIEQVVKSNKVVAFIKGTRTQPQCGFSYKVLSTLNEIGSDYEVLNVLDEIYNPGLREAIKGYSQWPTIPQLYVDGEFVGGADIVEEMHSNGELKQLLGA